jgi:hypothetical protein
MATQRPITLKSICVRGSKSCSRDLKQGQTFAFNTFNTSTKLAIGRKIAKGGQAKVFLAKYLKKEKDVIIRTHRGFGVDTNDL